MANGAWLSYIVVADQASTIEPVIRRLETQTAADEVEVVAVAPAEGRAGLEARLAGFARKQVLETRSIHPLGRARRLGVEAATATIVFIGETHTFPHPRFVESLVSAHKGPTRRSPRRSGTQIRPARSAGRSSSSTTATAFGLRAAPRSPGHGPTTAPSSETSCSPSARSSRSCSSPREAWAAAFGQKATGCWSSRPRESTT